MCRYSPTHSDHRAYLSCSTLNTLYPDMPREDGYILDIKCKEVIMYRVFLTSCP